MTANQPMVLFISGFDPSGGAGILADIKTAAAFDCYGIGAVTSLTVQSTTGVVDVQHQSAALVRNQLQVLFGDFDISAVKTGMLPTREVVETVVSVLSKEGAPNIVVDPVFRSSSGFDLIDDQAFDALIDSLLPLAAVITPNWSEAQRITTLAIGDHSSAERAGKAILELGPLSVLVTGGDDHGELATDVLVDKDGTTLFQLPRLQPPESHGTGCTLASAIACLLARSLSVHESVRLAKHYVRQAISGGMGLGQGTNLLDHFPAEW